MPLELRLGFGLIAALMAVAGVSLIASDITPAQSVYIVFGAALLALGMYVAAEGWRSSLSVAGEVLTVRSALSAKAILRSEVRSIEAGSGGVFVTFVRDGRTHTTTAGAGQGMLNSFGGKLLRRETRTQQIVHQLAQWKSSTGSLDR